MARYENKGRSKFGYRRNDPHRSAGNWAPETSREYYGVEDFPFSNPPNEWPYAESHRGAYRDRGSRDERHSEFTEFHFGERVGDLTKRVRRFLGVAPKGYKRSDQRIYEDICDHIMRNGTFDPSDIEVKVQGGEVTLEGTVDDRYAKIMAEELSNAASGVQDVHNRLKIDRNRFQGVGRGNVSATPQVTGMSGERRSSD